MGKDQWDDVIDENARAAATTLRRKIAAILLGFFYGGSVVNGIEKGLDYVFRTDTGLSGWPVLEVVMCLAAVGAASFLAAYSSQSLATGCIAGGTSLAVIVMTPGRTEGHVVVAVLGGVAAIAFALFGVRFPLSTEDLRAGRLFGVQWAHWLWLWFPWQLAVANALWLVYPPTLLAGEGPSVGALLADLVKAPIALALLAYSVLRALASIRQDAPYSRLHSGLLFLGWFLLFPIIINLLRVFRLL